MPDSANRRPTNESTPNRLRLPNMALPETTQEPHTAPVRPTRFLVLAPAARTLQLWLWAFLPLTYPLF